MDITIRDVRFSYCNLFQPKPPLNDPTGEPKYSMTILIPKTNTAAKAAIDMAIAQAIEAGVVGKWNGVRPPQPAVPIHDGDGPRPSDGSAYGSECMGMWVITASSKTAPFVVDAQMQAVIDPTKVYSGMWGNVSISLYPYNANLKKGIGCGLNGVQTVRDDEPLGGRRVTAEEAFQPVASAPAAQPQPVYAYPQQPQTPAYPQQAATAPAYVPAVQPQVNPATGEVYQPSGMNIFGIPG